MSQPYYNSAWSFVAQTFGSHHAESQAQSSKAHNEFPEVAKLRTLLSDHELKDEERLVAFFNLCLETRITAEEGLLSCLNDESKHHVAGIFRGKIVNTSSFMRMQDSLAVGTQECVMDLSQAVASTHEELCKQISEDACTLSEKDRNNIEFACHVVTAQPLKTGLWENRLVYLPSRPHLARYDAVTSAFTQGTGPINCAFNACEVYGNSFEMLFDKKILDGRALLPEAATVSKLKDTFMEQYALLKLSPHQLKDGTAVTPASLIQCAQAFNDQFWKLYDSHKEPTASEFAASKCIELWKAHTSSSQQI